MPNLLTLTEYEDLKEANSTVSRLLVEGVLTLDISDPFVRQLEHNLRAAKSAMTAAIADVKELQELL